MKITKTDLVVALGHAKKFIAKRSNLPILQQALFDPENQRIVATDLETTAHIALEMTDFCRKITVAKKKQDFIESFCVDPASLLDMVKTAEGEIINISIEEEKGENLFKSDYYKLSIDENFTSIYAMPGNEFPSVTPEETSHVVELTGKTVHKVTCLKNGDTNGYGNILNCVLFDGEKNRLVTTDGHRLHMVDEKLSTDEQILIPIEALRKSACIADEKISISSNKTHTEMIVGKIRVVTRNEDGKFPEYEGVVPKKSKHKITVDKSKLEKTCDQAIILLSSNHGGAKFCFNKVLSAEMVNPDKGTFQKTDVPIKGKIGEKIEVGLNVRYLKDALNCIDKDEVQVELTDANSPFIFSSHENFRALIMPMRI